MSWHNPRELKSKNKCRDKDCKIARLGLKLVPRSKLYNASWVNNNSIAINERCLFPMKFLDYHDEIWCDRIPNDVGNVILGRPWIYDLYVIISGRSNSCSFVFKGRKIKLIGLPPRPNNKNRKKKNVNGQRLNTMSPNMFENKVKEHVVSGLVVK